MLSVNKCVVNIVKCVKNEINNFDGDNWFDSCEIISIEVYRLRIRSMKLDLG